MLHDVPVGAGALNVAFDDASGLAYVSNRGAGTVTVVNGDGKVVANLDGGTLPNHVRADGRQRVRGERRAALRTRRVTASPASPRSSKSHGGARRPASKENEHEHRVPSAPVCASVGCFAGTGRLWRRVDTA